MELTLVQILKFGTVLLHLEDDDKEDYLVFNEKEDCFELYSKENEFFYKTLESNQLEDADSLSLSELKEEGFSWWKKTHEFDDENSDEEEDGLEEIEFESKF